jgi:ribA/ribD-fused uncharacterized protein
MNACYLLFTDGGRRTYIGATNDPDRRLRQHNRELVGGARATQGKAWNRLVYIHGFPDWTAALQFEWAWKRISRPFPGVAGKIHGLYLLLQKGKSTSSSIPYICFSGPLYSYFSTSHLKAMEKIESIQKLLVALCAPALLPSPHTVPSLSFPILFPFPFQQKMSAPIDIDNMIVSFDLLKTEVEQLKARLEAALTRLAAPAASGDESTGAPKKRGRKSKKAAAEGATDAESGAEGASPAKKARKPREPKEKPTCPPAAEGVIRYYSCAGDSKYKAFSNLYRAPFTLDEKEYGSVEAYFQSAKFADTDAEYAEKIRTTKNPVLVKGMGRSKAHPLRADWETVKLDVMRRALEAKFSAHPELKELLVGTGAALIEEEAATDSFWGIGADGAGTNWSGKLLMELRTKLVPAPPSGPAATADKPAADKPKTARAKKPAPAASAAASATA